MENTDLHKIWKKNDHFLNNLNKEQLKLILMKKQKRILKEFALFHIISVGISACAAVYLILSAIMRNYDGYFILINGILLLIVIAGLIGSLIAIRHFKPSISEDTNMHDFIEDNIWALEKKRRNVKYQNLILLIIIILFSISIQVFFAAKPISEIPGSSFSVLKILLGLIIGVPLGMFLSLKIVSIYNGKLKQLKDNMTDLEKT